MKKTSDFNKTNLHDDGAIALRHAVELWAYQRVPLCELVKVSDRKFLAINQYKILNIDTIIYNIYIHIVYSLIVNSPRLIQNLAFSWGGLPGKVAPTCV